MPVTVDRVKRYLVDPCGYSDRLLRRDFRFGSDKTVALAAFAHEPMDARSACIAAVEATATDVVARVFACRDLGAPAVIALTPANLQLWKQGQWQPKLVYAVPATGANSFFRAHKEELAPDVVFRAKMWGRLNHEFQRRFVDAGLMPVIEAEMGEHLTGLIERVVQEMRRTAWPRKTDVALDDEHWLVKSAFWLLAAKILRDKHVEGFISLDFGHPDDVLQRVARHYDSQRSVPAQFVNRTREQRNALEQAATEIEQFSHLGNVTTESLAHVYERALITKETRTSLGTHSTPQYLVDYIVWKLAPWIEQIPVDKRDVFEPACGHAAFLVTSMRLLKELLPPNWTGDRQRYLRKHLHGVEIDPFALEIARLSLTLADIPNPDGWDLVRGDMFADTHLRNRAKQATIILGNPPFEQLSKTERERYNREKTPVHYRTKTAEVLNRVLPELGTGSVFGLVVPQGLLHSKETKDLRKFMCDNCEILEICLLPDKVFSHSDAESAVVLGRRVNKPVPRHEIRCERVREQDLNGFRQDYVVPIHHYVAQEALERSGYVLRVPDLSDIWGALEKQPRLADVAEIGQGLVFHGRDLPQGARTVAPHSRGGTPGFVRFEVNYIHELPSERPMILTRSVIRRTGTGACVGRPQVLLNYAPVSRGPWRMKALIDKDGHPVTSSFITVRPRSFGPSLEYLWGILNGPLANAYAYAHSTKRNVLVGLIRKLPIPVVSEPDIERVTRLARDYLECVRQSGKLGGKPLNEESTHRRLLELDAEVLRLYDLSPKHERELLDLFAGYQRAGVPFTFDRYFPDDFEPWLHLHEYLSDDFRRSTAGALREAHRDIHSPELEEALRRAVEDFEE